VQIDPIKPKLKPPGTKRLKLNCDELLSTSAFKFNLRRYNLEYSTGRGGGGGGGGRGYGSGNTSKHGLKPVKPKNSILRERDAMRSGK